MSFVATNAASSLARAMTRLWVDHVVWTREYLVAAIPDDRPEKDAAATRLLENQEHIGNAIVPFYGEEAGERLTDLLKQHILIAVDLVEAAKTGDQEKFEESDRAWDRNAQDIGTFLSEANPDHWPVKDLVDILSLHLSLTKEEATSRLERNWEKDVAAFDQILTEILVLSDTLIDGIVKQFPEKFAA